MMNPVTLFNRLTYETTPIDQMPVLLRFSLKGLQIVHWGWWIYRKKKIYSDKNNTLALAGGHLLNLTVGDGMLRTAAKLLLIITRIDECRERIISLNKGYKNLCDALMGRYRNVIKPAWGEHSSPQRHSQFSRIRKAVSSLFKRFGKLAMHMWDAYDAFYVANDALPELFVNGLRWMDRLKNNTPLMLARLKSNRELIDKIIIGMAIPTITADQVIQGVEFTFNMTEKGMAGIEKINNIGGGILYDFGKDSAIRFVAALGMEFP